ncbi:MAG: ribosome maturation factor RimM [Pseudomonadota bacterium]
MTKKGFIAIGKIVGAHGIYGAVKVYAYSESFSVFETGNTLYLKNDHDSTGSCYRIKGFTPHSRFALVFFEGVDARDMAHSLKGFEIFIEKSKLPELEEKTYYWDDIIGLYVYTSDGDYLGKIESIIQTGSNDVYVVKNEGKEVLVPALESVVLNIDLDQKTMKVKLPEGL